MVRARRLPVQGLAAREPNLCTAFPGEVEDHLHVPILLPLVGDQETLDRPASFQGLEDGIDADDLVFGHFDTERQVGTETGRRP